MGSSAKIFRATAPKLAIYTTKKPVIISKDALCLLIAKPGASMLWTSPMQSANTIKVAGQPVMTEDQLLNLSLLLHRKCYNEKAISCWF